MKSARRRPGWEGHLLLLYHEESQRRSEVRAWVRNGLQVGAKILYIEPEDESHERSLSGLLEDHPDAVDAMDRGQIQVIPANHVAYDPAWQASTVERALRRYPVVRWSGDVRTAWGVMPQGRHAEIEWATDDVCHSRPVSVMCQYPVRASMGLLGPVSAAHRAGLRERLLRVTPLDGGGLALRGELELSNQDIMRSVLVAATAATTEDQFAVDLSGLDFVDVGGIRTLRIGTAPYRRRGGQVLLRAAQQHVDRILRMLGVDREQGFLTEALG